MKPLALALACYVLAIFCAIGANAGAPTVTHATWNPSDKYATISLSGGNLQATGTAGTNSWHSVRATQAMSGKAYFEIKWTGSGTDFACGVANAITPLDYHIGTSAGGWAFNHGGHAWRDGSVAFSVGPTMSTNAVCGIAYDEAAGKAWLRVNGTWIGDPVAGTGATFTGLTGAIFPAFSGSVTALANFGASAFANGAPSGFKSGVYTLACPEGETLSEDETNCEAPEPLDGSGFAIAGMGVELTGMNLAVTAMISLLVGAGAARMFIEGWNAA